MTKEQHIDQTSYNKAIDDVMIRLESYESKCREMLPSEFYNYKLDTILFIESLVRGLKEIH